MIALGAAGSEPYVLQVDRAEAIARLPATYRRLHQWLEEGIPDEEMAERLGVPIEALPGLVSVAFAKLANLEAAGQGGDVDPGTPAGE